MSHACPLCGLVFLSTSLVAGKVPAHPRPRLQPRGPFGQPNATCTGSGQDPVSG